jgi:chromosome segregation ATPase
MERAVAAELSSKGSVAEAKAKVKLLEKERDAAVASMQAAIDKLAVAEKKLKEKEDELRESVAMHKQTVDSSKATATELNEAKGRLAILEGDLEHSQSRCNSLRDDVATLREQLKRAEAAVQSIETEAKDAQVVQTNRHSDADGPSDDATVRILQEELRDANKAIEDLKDALASALALNEQYERVGAASPRRASHASSSDSSSTPLFYAMEKQAELNTARDEIMRLANRLSDVQSEKMEAIELKEGMRRRMEEAEARLQRYEKLSHPSNSSSANGASRDGGSTNIEYLKNIMLRYLNAKTLAEKKALVPVIGAVLCLTPDEQQAAVRNLDESASLGGVGSSIFDTLSSKLR